MIHVMVVDDQRLIRDVVRMRLESDKGIEVVAEAASGEQARRLIAQSSIDVVLMDLNMPGIGGVEATGRLIKANPGLKVVALSMYTGGPEPLRFLAAGGIGYVSKDDGAEELVTAIKRAYRGSRYVSAQVAGNLCVDIKPAALQRLDALTSRELQVLKLIAQGRAAAEVARQLHISVKTVRFHRGKLLQKLQASNDVQLARIAWDLGLRAD